jgi:hypothetical protein
MRVFLEAAALGAIIGAAFALGRDLWGWLACRYFPKFRADRTVVTVDVDATEAMATLASLKESLEAVGKAAGAVQKL